MKPISDFPPLLKGGAFFIDNSTYESLMDCHRKAEYRILHKREFGGKANALNFGGAVHAGLDVRYRGGEFAQETLQAQLAAVIGYLQDQPTDDWRTAELACDVLHQYSLTYPADDFSVVEKEGHKFVELPFAVPLGVITLPEPMMLPDMMLDPAAEGDYRTAALAEGILSLRTFTEIPIIWCGKIDLVVIHNGKFWICDHKTTSMFGDTYFQQYNLSSQFMGYKWALQESLQVSIEGVLINALAIRKPTKTGKGISFHRMYMPTEGYLIEEWHRNTLSNIGSFFQSLAEGYFQMQTTSCRTKWHSNCEYLQVCTLPEEQRDMYIGTGDFRDVTWSPLRDE